jgi:uncharacterized membrane protein
MALARLQPGAGCSSICSVALVIGLLVTIPVSSLAFTHAYRVLSGRTPPPDAAMMARAA